MVEIKQLNLKLCKKLNDDAEKYSEKYGYNNVQEVIREALRKLIYK